MNRSVLIILAMAATAALAFAGLTWATPGSGVTSTLLQRATTDARIQLLTHPGGLHDLVVLHVALQPGGFSGWHSHPGAKLGAVKAGVIAYYSVTPGSSIEWSAGAAQCTVRYFRAGDAFYVEPNEVHYIRNEGSAVYEDYSAFVIPYGVAVRTDEPAPAAINCPQ